VESAVLVPTYERIVGGASVRVVVLVRRTDVGAHAGQLAFPGGKREPVDASPLETAMREAEEELGLTPDAVRAVERLPPVRTLTTRFEIHPFLAEIVPPAAWRPDPREIAEVLEVVASDLADPAARGWMRIATLDYPGGRDFAYIRVGTRRLWGATYRILEPILSRLVDGPAIGSD
jgi:8-oxo-dGTP pyrophosphatase MutT (NUDIX family)